MARSKRKFKKGKPKVRVGLQKKRKGIKGPVPLVVPGSDNKLEWNETTTLAKNYQSSGILTNPNRMHPSEQTLTDEIMDELETDDLRSALGKKRKDGKQAPLQRLTKMQRVYMGRLIKEYRDDFEAMSKDMKLNRMQHPPGVLKKLCARFEAYDNLTKLNIKEST